MAFGGAFNPNFQQFSPYPQQTPPMATPQQLPAAPQMPNKPQQDPNNPFASPFAFGMFTSLYGNNKPGQTPTTPPQLPQVPTLPPAGPPPQQYEPFPTTPPFTGGTPIPKPGQNGGLLSNENTGTPIPKPGQGSSTPSLPYIPNGVMGQPGQYAAPNPGNQSMGLTSLPPATSADDAYNQALAQYNSPEYAAYYNSLAPSTRAYMHAPGNSATGQYLADGARSNYQAFGNNVPWVPNR
jgi:hypothetical protein